MQNLLALKLTLLRMKPLAAPPNVRKPKAVTAVIVSIVTAKLVLNSVVLQLSVE
jgi:hypothetical protein